jgi:hypothetical protein
VPEAHESVGSPEQGEVLRRRGKSRESVGRLQRKAAEAEESNIGIHGVWVSAAEPSPNEEVSNATRIDVEKIFRVHETPTRSDPLHRTVELPKPITPEVAEQFNRLFGRG